MKLGEAILERDGLEERLKTLEIRVEYQYSKDASADLQKTANRVRDLNIAVSWTESQVSLSGLPLSAYRHRIDMLRRLAKALESNDSEKADTLWESAHNDHKVLVAATWLVDLQIPKVDPAKPETKEVER